jgi:nicotinamidase-related amidase
MKQALLVMDMQRWIVGRYTDPRPLLAGVAQATAAARSAGIPVIYVRVAFRPGGPEISRNNRGFTALKASEEIFEGDPGNEFHPDITPGPGDIVVTKKRVSAFVGNDLQLILQGLGIEELVLCGSASSGSVLSTVLQASDLDYRTIVLRDGCGDRDRELHEFLMDRFFPSRAAVVATREWIERL